MRKLTNADVRVGLNLVWDFIPQSTQIKATIVAIHKVSDTLTTFDVEWELANRDLCKGHHGFDSLNWVVDEEDLPLIKIIKCFSCNKDNRNAYVCWFCGDTLRGKF
jgi:hypothetical protein